MKPAHTPSTALSTPPLSLPPLTTDAAQALEMLRSAIKSFKGRSVDPSGEDLREIIGLTERITGAPLQGAPIDPAKVPPGESGRLCFDVVKQIFLPRNELLNVRMVGDRYELLEGTIDPSSRRSVSYLGRTILTATVRFTHGVENSMGLTLDDVALSDLSLIKRDCETFLTQLPGLTHSCYLAAVLQAAIKSGRFSPKEYTKTAGHARVFFEELQHAKDNVFMERASDPSPTRSAIRPVGSLLKPNSPLNKLLRLDNPASNAGSTALLEYSSSLGGIIMELDDHLQHKRFKDANVALADFFTQQWIRASVNPGASIGTIYYLAGIALFANICETLGGDTDRNITRIFRLGSSSEQDVRSARKLLSELYKKDLYADHERPGRIKSDQSR